MKVYIRELQTRGTASEATKAQLRTHRLLVLPEPGEEGQAAALAENIGISPDFIERVALKGGRPVILTAEQAKKAITAGAVELSMEDFTKEERELYVRVNPPPAAKSSVKPAAK